jgi:hypothetical protein
MKVVQYVLGVLCITACPLALAQATVGAVLEAGGKQLMVEELKSLLPSSTIAGKNTGGHEFRYVSKKDGVLSGSVTGPEGRQLGMTGTWSINDKGQVCGEHIVNLRSSPYCMAIYRRDADYFAAYHPEGEITAQSPVSIRTISK